MAKNSPNDVLARYGAWYHGDDDLFAHCLILRGGQCTLLFQGLQTVTVKLFRAPKAKHERLVALLKQPIPSGWPNASYAGYNFITDAWGRVRARSPSGACSPATTGRPANTTPRPPRRRWAS